MGQIYPFVRASTILNTFTFHEDPAGITNLLLTYKQSNTIILEKHKSDFAFTSHTEGGVTYWTGVVQLTQVEANKFVPNVPVHIQIRRLSSTGDCSPSKEWEVPVKDVLNDEVLT